MPIMMKDFILQNYLGIDDVGHQMLTLASPSFCSSQHCHFFCCQYFLSCTAVLPCPLAPQLSTKSNNEHTDG